MVAPADPAGIVRAGAPARVDHTIDAWGYVMTVTDRRRALVGWLFFGGGFLLVLVLAFLLVRFGGYNKHANAAANMVRSGEMEPAILADAVRQHNIRSVVRLVGTDGADAESYRREAEACRELGVRHYVAKMAATRLPWRSELRRLFEVLDEIAADPSLQPVLIHCSAGSDRTGLASVIWMHDYKGVPYAEARRQLAWDRYMHVRFGAAGEMTDFLSMYEAYLAENPRPRLNIGQWVARHYFVEKPGRQPEPWLDGTLYRP